MRGLVSIDAEDAVNIFGYVVRDNNSQIMQWKRQAVLDAAVRKQISKATKVIPMTDNYAIAGRVFNVPEIRAEFHRLMAES